MQDKITLAIDALASAAFIEGGVSPENTQAARDLTEQRKRELAQAISSPCLHQIQEPPTKTEALAHYSQQAILAMGEAGTAPMVVPDEREAFKAWWRQEQLKTFPKDYEMSRLENWGADFKPHAWDGWQARAALAATPAAASEQDAQIIDFVTKQYIGPDFRWGDPSTEVMVIEMPKGSSYCGDFRTDISAAIATQQGGAA